MRLQEIKVPDIGGDTEVSVVEVLIAVGDQVDKEQSLVSLESDKAVIEVPSPLAGTVVQINVSVEDKVSENSPLVVLETAAVTSDKPVASDNLNSIEPNYDEKSGYSSQTPRPASKAHNALQATVITRSDNTNHAGPSVRKYARELGVDITLIAGTGRKGRIVRSDVQTYVNQVVAGSGNQATTAGELNLIPWPKPDYSQYGEIERKALSRIKKISGANLHRNWVRIPHVTNHDETDITDLESLRLELNSENLDAGIKITLLVFLVKACAAALKQYPNFNASLDGDELVLKQYFNIGFAADTPQGLVVPVIRNVDKKGIVDIAREMASLSGLAREGKLKPEHMQGGCFSISSLGGIGGTYFTPIINAPEVSILGVCRATLKPTWNAETLQFAPRLILPLSLSWDHRVIDGAEAGRFLAHLKTLLEDFRRISL